MLLTRGVAGAIDVTIPCRLGPQLDASTKPTIVLATMRHPIRGGGLAIIKQGRELAFKFGTATFATFATAPVQTAGTCEEVAFRLTGDRWTLRVPSGKTEHGDFGGAAPAVTSLFSGIDLQAGPGPRVLLTTLPYGAKVAWWQWPAWLCALGLALGAAVAAFGLPHRRPLGRGSVRRAAQRLHPVDALVAILLLVWWVVGPVFYDDGWVKVRQTNGLVASGFSNYYTAYGTNLPLDFWSEWLQHWVVAHSSVILVMRLPTLALLFATWIVCRSVFARLVAGLPSSGATWALGVAFLLNTTAWGMTLRPEPIVALLLVSVLALAVGFADNPSGWRLLAAGILVALSIATHPAGLIALAPVLAVGPHILGWARSRRWLDPACVFAGTATILIVVLTIGSTARQRAAEGRLIRQSGDATASWREELTRYLFTGAEGTVLRRASLALMIAALVGYLARRRNGSRLDVAGTSLALALILLIPTPSKWSWHFGALIGLAAVTVSAEVARLRGDASNLRWPVRPLVAYGLAVLIVGWALFPRVDWSTEFGLRTLSWTFGFEQRITLVRLSLITLALIFAAVVLIAFLRNGRQGIWRAPWTLVPWLVPLVALPLIFWTIGMFIADTYKTHGWTLTRQNVESLHGNPGCGLADDTLVADPASIRPLQPVRRTPATPQPEWLARTGAPVNPSFALLQRPGETQTQLPWFRVPPGDRAGYYVLNGVEAGDTVMARWGHTRHKRVHGGSWGTDQPPQFDVLGHRQSIPWFFVPQGALPIRPANTNAVQLGLASYARPPHALAATGAVGYRDATLGSLIRRSGAGALVWPNLALYMPCAHLPRLAGGVAQVPQLVVAHLDLIAVERTTAPFHGLSDLYRFRDLGVADSRVDPNGITVLWVDRRIPGAAVAPAFPVSA